jgi:histidine triad (HIT) family protein
MSGDMSGDNCIFCKIVRGEIPSKKIHEDADLLAFHDINPVTPVHFLIIPKVHIPSLAETDSSHAPILGKCLAIAGKLAAEQGCAEGFRTIVNTGRIGRQEVYHVHIHVLGGPQTLPPMIVRRG